LHNPFLCHPAFLQEGYHFSNVSRDAASLAQTNKRFNKLLTHPASLARFLEKFSSQISPQKRFELAF
jgi:hypothetical protein